MSRITDLNLGRTMEKKLNSVGIHSAEELTAVGSREAVARLKKEYPSTCVVILYHLQAAIEGVEMKDLPSEIREDLKNYFKSL